MTELGYVEGAGSGDEVAGEVEREQVAVVFHEPPNLPRTNIDKTPTNGGRFVHPHLVTSYHRHQDIN